MQTYVLCHDDGAHHAGAEVALLVGGDEVFRHIDDAGVSVEDLNILLLGGVEQDVDS